MVGDYKKSELILGLVAPVGVDLEYVQKLISDYLSPFNYGLNEIRLSKIIKTLEFGIKIYEKPEYKRISSLMDAGNKAREKTKRDDILAALAIYDILKKRKPVNGKDGEPEPLFERVHLIRSLKHPDEVFLLKKVYSHGFFLLGFFSSYKDRYDYLTKQKGMTEKQAERLIERDQYESIPHGQRTRNVFYLADAFIDMSSKDHKEQIRRIIWLLFGHPYTTPTRDEYAMFLAFSASLRSADLSRQVGAVVVSESKEIISTGANDVPKYGGGLYWSDDGENDFRDYKKKHDYNESQRNEILLNIIKQFSDFKDLENERLLEIGKILFTEKNKILQETTKLLSVFKDLENERLLEIGKILLDYTGLFDIAEYGRSVHAEMEALISCARVGVSPRNGILYTTTFPCHNCAKHIVAAGIREVVFVEPYPKSKALLLHDDSIFLEHESKQDKIENKVKFRQFVGVGPSRFFDLFSMKLSTGRILVREIEGRIVDWKPKKTSLRVPILPTSYIQREMDVVDELEKKKFK